MGKWQVFTGLIICVAGTGYSQDLEKIGKEKPLHLSGSLNASAQQQNVSTSNPFYGALELSPALSIYDLHLPFSFYLNTGERGFRQPFQEFGVSPYFRWATVHLGYRSVNYSEYTLQGERWLGGGLDLKPGWFRLAAMAGRFRKAVPGDSSAALEPVYERLGWGGKLGFGKVNGADLNYFHGEDEIQSGTAGGFRALPEESDVVSLQPRLSLFDQRITFEGEGALSLHSRDRRSPPLGFKEIPDLANDLLDLNGSTRWGYAVSAQAGFRSRPLRLRLKYSRINPDFQSLGAAYLRTDREEISLSPSWRILQSLLASGSVGWRRNNLEDQKLTTDKQLTLSLGLDWQANQAFGIGAQLSNYAAFNDDGRQRVNDTTRIDQVSRMYSLSPRLGFGSEKHPQNLSVYLALQEYLDENLLDTLETDQRTWTGNTAYSLQWTEMTSVQGGLNCSSASGGYFSSDLYGLNLGGTRQMLEGKLQTTIMASFNWSQVDERREFQVFPVGMASLRLRDKDYFHLQSQVSHNTATPDPAIQYTFSGGYSRTF